MLIIAQSGEKCIQGGEYQPACPRDDCCERTSYETGEEFKFCNQFHWMVWHLNVESSVPLEDSMMHRHHVPYDLAAENVRYQVSLVLRQ